jgi:histidyl-tRNA synthetase
MQCDIDIIGDTSVVAEVDLLAATLSTLETLGLGDAVIRVNHRWTLKKLLESWEVPDGKQLKTLVILDKLDKIGVDGVSNELESWLGYEFGERFQAWISSPKIQAIPEDLREIFEVFGNERLRYDPTLVRGMGYYTGSIFEIEHPASGSSIGGGGRYDGMVGRWTGTDVAAVGISIGFERVVDLVPDTDAGFDGVVLVLDDESQAVIAHALAVQKDLIAAGHAVRLEQRPKKLGNLLESLAEQGYTSWAAVDGSGSSLELKPLA